MYNYHTFYICYKIILLTLEEFALISSDAKRDCLAMILKKSVKRDYEKLRSFENFLLNADDDELVKFYGAILNPKIWDKLREEKLEETNKNQEKIMELNNQFWKASLKYKESEEKVKEDKDLHQLETLFED